MSKNYSAGQFDDAFAPRRLGNWEVTDKARSHRPDSRVASRRPTKVLANDKGHLLPGVPKSKKNVWGCLQTRFHSTGISCPCTLNRLLKSPLRISKRTRYSVPSFERQKRKILRETQCTKLRRSKSYDQLGVACLHYLQELRLPIIWVVGYPTLSIIRKRRQHVQQIARNLNFQYIELQEQLIKWSKRSDPSSYASPSVSSQCDYYDCDDVNRIVFDTTERFKTTKILQLLKFAMIENLPCEGFIIDCFPCNLDEAQEFERTFYPAAMGILFVAGTLRQIGGRQVKQMKGQKDPANRSKKDPILHPELLRRRHFYTQKDAVQICSRFGRKIIRVIETENLDSDTFGFLLDLIRSNLERNEVILSGQGKLACDFGFNSRECSEDSEGYETVVPPSSEKTLHHEVGINKFPSATTRLNRLPPQRPPTSYPLKSSDARTDLSDTAQTLESYSSSLSESRLKAPFNTACEEMNSTISSPQSFLSDPHAVSEIKSNTPLVPELVEVWDSEPSPNFFAHRSDSEIMKEIFNEIDDADEDDMGQREFKDHMPTPLPASPWDRKAFGDCRPRITTPHPSTFQLQEQQNNPILDDFESWFLRPGKPEFPHAAEGGDYRTDLPKKKGK